MYIEYGILYIMDKNKKSNKNKVESNGVQEQQDLYNTIWIIVNELRDQVDGWDFKQYVLGILFYRFNNNF